MNKILLLLLALPCIAFAQKKQSAELQIGVLTSIYDGGKGLGGELIGNFPIAKTNSIGFGAQVVKLDDLPSVYVPFFASLKFFIPANKYKFFVHLDPGYGFYNQSQRENTFNGQTGFTSEVVFSGGFYCGLGVGFAPFAATGPYINLQYSLYSLNTDVSIDGSSTSTSSRIDAFTISLGGWFHSKNK